MERISYFWIDDDDIQNTINSKRTIINWTKNEPLYPWYIESPAYGILLEPWNPRYFATKSYKDDPFAKTKTALKFQILESPASDLFYVTTAIATY